MKFKKRFLSILLVILSVLVLSSCNNGKTKRLEVSGDFKKNYYLDQVFDNAGMIVTYIEGDSETEVTDYEITGFDSSVVGTNTITVTYLDVSTKVQLTILFGDNKMPQEIV